MAACAMLSYNNVSEDAWNCILNAVAQFGVTPNGDAGTASSNGFTVSWNYDRTAGTLSLQSLDSPFWISCSTINSHINDVVESCLSQHRIEMSPMTPQ